MDMKELNEMIEKEKVSIPHWKILKKEWGSWDNIPLNDTQRAIVLKIIRDDQNGQLSC